MEALMDADVRDDGCALTRWGCLINSEHTEHKPSPTTLKPVSPKPTE